jgi:hypothetical protein
VPVVLSQNLDVYDGVSTFSARPAVMEINDDNTFTLAKVDRATNAKIEPVFTNVPLSQLTVKGTGSSLKFSHAGVTKRVDFSVASRAVGAVGGVIGMAVQSSMVNKSGVTYWVDALRTNGASVKYMSQGKAMGIGLGIGFGIVVVVIVVVVLVAVVGG